MPHYCSQGHENNPSNRFCTQCGQQLPLGSGQIIEKRYRIVRLLGQGGFGRTYLAEDSHRFNDRCVLKEFAPQVQSAPELQKAKELFEREAGTLHQLDHPQVPKFRELFQVDMGGGTGRLFLVQDYVEGSTYFDLFNSGKRLSEAEVTQFLCQMLPVLSYIHSKGVIHRDISPDNIILRESDRLPVLIDFGGVKQVAVTAVSNFSNIGAIQTRIGKKGYAPEEQMRNGQVFVSSDTYSLAVTALVLLTGKEPQALYDIYKGTWRWEEVKVSRQLQAVLHKMLAHKPSDRFAYAVDALETLYAQIPNISKMQTNVVAPQANPTPQPNLQSSPIPFKPNSLISRIQTLVVAPKAPPKPIAVAPAPAPIVPTPAPVVPNPNPQPVRQPPQFLSHLGSWGFKVMAGVAFILLSGYAGWAVMSSVIRSGGISAPPTAPNASEQNRTEKLLSRRQDLGIQEEFFNTLTNNAFYEIHPEVRGRTLTLSPEDADLREDWHNTGEELLDKLEQAQLSAAARGKLGSYVERDYQTWERLAQQGQLGGYTIDELTKQTDDKFNRLFARSRGEKLNLQTYGQIWYAIAADKVSQLETEKK